ncbi:hypothetical protein JXI42_13250 [bacterium]|nr:hypothetical protein [bacterium]
MIIWALVLVIINYILLLGILWQFPNELYYWNTLVSMLIALGMFYRIRTKTKEGLLEKYQIKLDQVTKELEDLKARLKKEE